MFKNPFSKNNPSFNQPSQQEDYTIDKDITSHISKLKSLVGLDIQKAVSEFYDREFLEEKDGEVVLSPRTEKYAIEKGLTHEETVRAVSRSLNLKSEVEQLTNSITDNNINIDNNRKLSKKNRSESKTAKIISRVAAVGAFGAGVTAAVSAITPAAPVAIPTAASAAINAGTTAFVKNKEYKDKKELSKKNLRDAIDLDIDSTKKEAELDSKLTDWAINNPISGYNIEDLAERVKSPLPREEDNNKHNFKNSETNSQLSRSDTDDLLASLLEEGENDRNNRKEDNNKLNSKNSQPSSQLSRSDTDDLLASILGEVKNDINNREEDNNKRSSKNYETRSQLSRSDTDDLLASLLEEGENDRNNRKEDNNKLNSKNYESLPLNNINNVEKILLSPDNKSQILSTTFVNGNNNLDLLNSPVSPSPTPLNNTKDRGYDLL